MTGSPSFGHDERSDKSIRIGISACLLGEKVRYDGGHKHDRYLTDTLGEYFEWVPVCPEVEVGLGTPRDTMRLEQVGDEVRLIMPKTARDLTQSMYEFAPARVEKLAQQDLGGYILKSDSPSCGLFRVDLEPPENLVVTARPIRKSGRGRISLAAKLHGC